MNKINFFLKSLEGLIKIILLSKKSFVTAKPTYSELLILGNGPSLKNEKVDIVNFSHKKDILAVNFFANANEFVEFMPTLYVINAKDFWFNDESRIGWVKDRNDLFVNIVTKTNWKMDLFVPLIAKKDKNWVLALLKNKFINLNYYNLTAVDENPRFFNFFLKRYLCVPRPHNVLVPSILFAINMNYEFVYIAGADHSWIPLITVTNDNKVLLEQKHFYGDQLKENHSELLSEKTKPMQNGSKGNKKLHEVLQKFYYSFKSYWFLKEFANMNNVKIINITSNSFIDAFDKKSIKSLLNKNS